MHKIKYTLECHIMSVSFITIPEADFQIDFDLNVGNLKERTVVVVVAAVAVVVAAVAVVVEGSNFSDCPDIFYSAWTPPPPSHGTS